MPIRDDCKIHHTVTIYHAETCNLYGCEIGEGSQIGFCCEIGEGVKIGKRTRISAYCFIPPGVEIGDDCFIAPDTKFANDKYPPSGPDWNEFKTIVQNNVKTGLGCRIGAALTLGEGCRIGMGAVVTRDVPPGATWVGVPAQEIRRKNP